MVVESRVQICSITLGKVHFLVTKVAAAPAPTVRFLGHRVPAPAVNRAGLELADRASGLGVSALPTLTGPPSVFQRISVQHVTRWGVRMMHRPISHRLRRLRTSTGLAS